MDLEKTINRQSVKFSADDIAHRFVEEYEDWEQQQRNRPVWASPNYEKLGNRFYELYKEAKSIGL